MGEYINKPVPEEAKDTHQFFAGEKIFALEALRFLVNDKNIVTFEYVFKPQFLKEEQNKS